jgi:hypothetical protein
MSTEAVAPGCRTCVHFVSSAEAAALNLGGVCEVHLTDVTWTDWCDQHDPLVTYSRSEHILIERRCTRCSRTDIYSLGYGTEAYCAYCDFGADEEENA